MEEGKDGLTQPKSTSVLKRFITVINIHHSARKLHRKKRYIRQLQERSYVLGCQRADFSTIGNVLWDFNTAAHLRKNTRSCNDNIKKFRLYSFISVGNNLSCVFVKVRSAIYVAVLYADFARHGPLF